MNPQLYYLFVHTEQAEHPKDAQSMCDLVKIWSTILHRKARYELPTTYNSDIVDCELVMLKYRKSLVSIRINTVSILVPYITIQEILDKLKIFLERNVRNVLETLTTNYWNILIMILWNLQENLGATSEICTKEKRWINFNGKFRNNSLERV